MRLAFGMEVPGQYDFLACANQISAKPRCVVTHAQGSFRHANVIEQRFMQVQCGSLHVLAHKVAILYTCLVQAGAGFSRMHACIESANVFAHTTRPHCMQTSGAELFVLRNTFDPVQPFESACISLLSPYRKASYAKPRSSGRSQPS